ncbi:MAG: proline--tRNA ligase [Spirochaetes bacterium]|nr:proline--tRNA ligase [Spirochaetota bacterium]
MRYSAVHGKTLREPPHEVKFASSALLIQGGYIRPLGQGLFSYLPLGIKTIERIKGIIRKEMDRLGGQEVLVPLINPAEIWKKSGRYEWIHKEMIRFKDRNNHELVIAPTHEEAMIELVKGSLLSYRELPLLLYEFQIKFRDEEKPRGGLMRAKEFLMKDAYSFHRSFYSLNDFFPKIFASYKRIFKKCGIKIITAEAGVGFIGGKKSYEFLMPLETGDDTIISCEKCHYLANRNIATTGRDYHTEKLLKTEKVYTPDRITIDELAGYLGITKDRCAKSIVYHTGKGLVMAVVRGDYEISEEKLSRSIEAPVFRLASDDELHSAGLVPGFLSPLGIKGSVEVVTDDTIVKSSNLVYGANEKDYHLKNINYGRDYTADNIADISLPGDADVCLQCGCELKEIKAVEIGHIFKLGDGYSKALNLHFQDDNGKKGYAHIGCYGIGIGRLLSAIVESNHDERGIVWPYAVSPYQMYLITIGKSNTVKKTAEDIYKKMEAVTLFDDRSESPGVKLKDSDLLGIPVRVVVSSRNLNRGVIEISDRKTGFTRLIPKEKITEEISALFNKQQKDV